VTSALTPADLWRGPVFYDARLPGDYRPQRHGLVAVFGYPMRFSARCEDSTGELHDIALLRFAYLDGGLAAKHNDNEAEECAECDYIVDLVAASIVAALVGWNVTALSATETIDQGRHIHQLEVAIDYDDWVTFNSTEIAKTGASNLTSSRDAMPDVFTSVVDQIVWEATKPAADED
jgi:hypothetical protein